MALLHLESLETLFALSAKNSKHHGAIVLPVHERDCDLTSAIAFVTSMMFENGPERTAHKELGPGE